MKFFLRLTPPKTTAQMQKVAMVNSKPRFYKPKKLRQAKETLKYHLASHIPPEMLTGPVELHVTWRFPKGRHKANEWKVTRPDTDNLQKMLKDCMTELGFWKDDAQVVRETCEKLWSDEPCGIEITCKPLGKLLEPCLGGK